MAIQLPTIKADQQTTQPAENIRLTPPSLNFEQPIQEIQGAAQDAARQIIKYHDDQAYHAADTTGTDIANKIQLKYKQLKYGDPGDPDNGVPRTIGLMEKVQNGSDPRKLWTDFDQQMEDYVTGLTNPKDQSFDNMTQNIVNRRVNRITQELQNDSLSAYSAATKKWDDNVKDTANYFNQNALYSLSGQVDPNHPETFAPIQAKLQERVDQAKNNALIYGGATRAEDGSIVLAPSKQAEIQQDVSDTLKKTLKNLYDTDKGDGVLNSKADAIKEQFASQIDPADMAYLNDHSKAGDTKTKAYSLASIIEQKGANAPEVVGETNNEVREQALKIATDHGRYMQDLKKQKQDTNFDTLSKYIHQNQNGPNPYTTMTQLQADKNYKTLYPNLSDKQQQAIDNAIVAPKTTSASAQKRLLDLTTGQEVDGKTLQDMTASDLVQAKSGMNKTDQNTLQKKWLASRTQTGAQEMTQSNNVTKELLRQAAAAGLVRKQPGTNYIVSTDEPAFDDMRKELTNNLPNGPMSPKEIETYVAKMVATRQAGQVFDRSKALPARFNGSTQAPPPPPAGPPAPAVQSGVPKSDALKDMSQGERDIWLRQYLKENKTTIAPSPAKLNEYISNKKAQGR